MNTSVEKMLDDIVGALPAVTGTGWMRKQNENGAKVYELRVTGENDERRRIDALERRVEQLEEEKKIIEEDQ